MLGMRFRCFGAVLNTYTEYISQRRPRILRESHSQSLLVNISQELSKDAARQLRVRRHLVTSAQGDMKRINDMTDMNDVNDMNDMNDKNDMNISICIYNCMT